MDDDIVRIQINFNFNNHWERWINIEWSGEVQIMNKRGTKSRNSNWIVYLKKDTKQEERRRMNESHKCMETCMEVRKWNSLIPQTKTHWNFITHHILFYIFTYVIRTQHLRFFHTQFYNSENREKSKRSSKYESDII